MKYIVENTYSGECFIADSLEEAFSEIRGILEANRATSDELSLYSAKPLAMIIDTTPRITLVDPAE